MANRITYKYGPDGKLVRGGKFERMLADGQEPVYEIVAGEELRERAMRKPKEELDEYMQADTRAEKVAELGDMLEAVHFLAFLDGISLCEVAQALEEKRKKAGDFMDGIVVRAVTVTEGDEWDEYYNARPHVFIRMENPHEPQA
jgi:predicted house-cleaning noncanonical NTP pyrophosphatase (MazG superfamily)